MLQEALKELAGAAASYFSQEACAAFFVEVLALGRDPQAVFAQLAQENTGIKMEVGLLIGTVVYDVTQHATGALTFTVVPVKAITGVHFMRQPEQGHLRIVAAEATSALTYTAATASTVQQLAAFAIALRGRLQRGT